MLRTFAIAAATAVGMGSVCGQVMDWVAASGLDSSLESEATAAASDGAGNVVVAGHFRGVFQPVALSNPRGWDGYLWKLGGDGSPQWALPAQLAGTDGDVRVSDVVVAPDGRIFCSGRYDGELELGAGGIGLPVPPTEQGFVAWCDANGDWLGAFPVAGMFVDSLAVDGLGGVYVTGGGGDLARKYQENGSLLWKGEGGSGITATSIAEQGGQCYVAGTIESGTAAFGHERILLTADPGDPAVTGQTSGVFIETTSAIDYTMTLGAFGGGRVRVVVENPAGAQAVAQAGAGYSVGQIAGGVEVTADASNGPEGEVEFVLTGVTRVRVEVDFLQAAAEPPGTVIDYAIELSSFTGPLGVAHAFDLSAAEGVVADSPFQFPAGDQGGSGIDLTLSSVPSWGPGHIADIHAGVVPAPGVLGARDVFLAKLGASVGNLEWVRGGGSDDSVRPDEAGEVGIDPWGRVRFGFAAGGTAVTFGGQGLGSSGLAAGESFVVNVDGSGAVVWGVACGLAEVAGAVMGVPSLDVDGDGVAWTSASIDGAFRFHSGLPHTGETDAVVVGIGAGGSAYLAEWSSGQGAVQPLGVARDEGVTWVVGRSSGEADFGNEGLPNGGDGGDGFVAVLGEAANQQRLLIVPSAAGQDAEVLRLALVSVGAQPYLELPQVDGSQLVAVHVRDSDVASVLGLAEVAGTESDAPVEVAGTSADAGWALGRLNLESPVAAAGPWSFEYEETCVGVKLYLIDTAVDVGAPFVAGLGSASLEPIELVRGYADPVVPVLFEHGSRMLGLVAGADSGSAPASPMVVKNYDVFPSATGSVTYVSYLATAIYRAIADHADDLDAAGGEAVPAVMLISLTSTAPASSVLLDSAIAAAVDEGICVVVSAGNSGAGAAGYVPAAAGSSAGVLCVGGCTKPGAFWGGSNHGAAVDLLAPGEAVRVPDLSGGLTVMDGTSASAALVAGAAVVCLATNPDATPAAIEQYLVSDAASSLGVVTGLPAGTPAAVLHLAADGVAGFYGYEEWIVDRVGALRAGVDDEDEDGESNFFEFVRGGNPLGGGGDSGIEFDLGSSEAEVRVVVSKGLWGGGAPALLRDGSSIALEVSDDLESWETPEGVLFEIVESVSNTRQLVKATFASGGWRFVRIKATQVP